MNTFSEMLMTKFVVYGAISRIRSADFVEAYELCVKVEWVPNPGANEVFSSRVQVSASSSARIVP